ncbi:MAG TPA: radical SAM protein [Thermodesulfovibrionales bacterium]|nr:radical SAM protein [Thermodesulfovibrionales bacterium]
MNKFTGLLQIVFLELRRKLFGTRYITEFDVTNACNLRCRHCYKLHGNNGLKKAHIPITQWEKRFYELHQSGIRIVLLVGGEPALRQDVLMLADKIFPFVYVITNGTIKIPAEFKHRLYVSVDGAEETNDEIRGPGVFSKLLQNYSGDHRVIINMTINAQNYPDLERVVHISQQHGFRGVVCNIYTPAFGDDEQSNPLFITQTDRTKIMHELRRVKSRYPDDFLLSDAMIRWYEETDHRGWCYWGDCALHFDVSWNKRRCFGNNADCSNCGCLAGSVQSNLTMLLRPKEMLKIGFL